MRLQATRTSVTSTGGAGDALYRAAGSRPILDQRFAKDKSLVDKVSGQNLITFTRASNATYVGSDGLIKTSSYNLLKYSQELDNALWTTPAGSTSALATGVIAPDGTESAYVVTSSAANGIIRQDVNPISSNSAHTWSCFIKKKTSSEVVITPVFVGGTSYVSNLTYNFDTDTITLASDDYGNSLFGREIFPNGWVRIYATVTDQGSNTSARFYIRPSETEASDMYAWGAQLQAGSLGEYTKTEDLQNGAPRFDHDPTTGESLGLLIEEAKTNLLTNSSGDINSSYWTKSSMQSGSTVDGPAGANTAIQYLSAGGTVVSKLQTAANNYPTTVIGKQYVLSCYVKGVNYNAVTFGGTAGGFGSNTRCKFNISDGTLLVQPTAAESARAIPAGNGWYRLEVVTIAATAAATFALFLDLGNGNAEPHTTSEGFQVYGFQVEEGTFVSSYIPTTNAQATRAEDSVLISSTNFSNFYNQSSGTFVTTSSSVTNSESSLQRSIFLVNETGVAGNTFRHYVLYRGNGADDFSIASKSNNAAAFIPGSTGDPTYSNDTIAYGYSSSEISKVFYDGSLITSSASVLDWTTYTADQLNIGGFAKLSGHISRLAYFPTKRTDQELINVTGGDTAIPVITYGITSAGGVFNLRSTGTVDYAVDWDSSGGYETSTSNTLAHTYTAGNYDLVVYSDSVYRPYFNNVTADANQITSVVIGSGANLGTVLANAWYDASNMTSFVCAFDVTSGVTSFDTAWRDCNSLTSFPLINTSSGTIFSNAWRGCTSLTSFPLINTSSGTIFSIAWRSCNSLTSFPLIDTSSGTTFINAWRDCSSLTSFPANMFDTTGTLVAGAFGSTWNNCALTAQSIENILVSLDTNGATGVTLGINGGTNAAKTTWSAAAVTAYDNLIVKGWTITFNA